MRRPVVRALQGLVLSAGSPLGWLLLQWYEGSHPLLELLWRPGVYVYMLLGSAFAFAGFGWYLGRQEELHRQNSLHDALTGLYNTRYFWRRLAEECAFAGRHRRPLALLIGDLDFFKRVNDTWGHAAGDQVLVAVAGALMDVHRRGDTVARVGGEEFAVILPESNLRDALQVAERMREAVARLAFEFSPEQGEPLSMTMSFGAVVAPSGHPPEAHRLYGQADAAMYAAKAAGRNCVRVADAAVMPLPLPAVPAA